MCFDIAPKWQYKTLYEYSLWLCDSLASLRCQFLARACEHVFFSLLHWRHSPPLWQFIRWKLLTVELNSAWGFFVSQTCVYAYDVILHDGYVMLCRSCTHSLMYFNAFFTLTKSVRVITCCFHLVEEKNYRPINLFTSYMCIYSTRPHLICASFKSGNCAHIIGSRQSGCVRGA